MKTIKQLVSKLDILFFETSEKSYQEYQETMDKLEELSPSVMLKVISRHARW